MAAGFTFAYTTSGGPPVIKNLPLVHGTAYKAGSVMRIVATTGSAGRAAAAGTSILGVMACDVTQANASSGKYPVYIANDSAVFQAKQIGSVAPPERIGDCADIALATIHNYRISSTAASTAVLSIVGYPGDESTSAHTGCNYYVKFARSIFAQTKSDNSK